MKSWETTFAGIIAAVGSVLQHDKTGPPWVSLLGECLSAAGLATLGYAAASTRTVTKQVEEQANKTT